MDCEPMQWVLNVTEQLCHWEHIICKKTGIKSWPLLPEPESRLSQGGRGMWRLCNCSHPLLPFLKRRTTILVCHSFGTASDFHAMLKRLVVHDSPSYKTHKHPCAGTWCSVWTVRGLHRDPITNHHWFSDQGGLNSPLWPSKYLCYCPRALKFPSRTTESPIGAPCRTILSLQEGKVIWTAVLCIDNSQRFPTQSSSAQKWPSRPPQ